MRTIIITGSLWVTLLLVLGACSSSDQAGSAPAQDQAVARTPVTVQAIGRGGISNSLTLFGTTLYLRRNAVTAPVAAFITKVYVSLGQRVQSGQPLYQLETKERRALGNLSVGGDSALLGRIIVKAASGGLISTFDKQQTGDYVLEGTQLCTIAEDNALAVQVNVPYEYQALAKPGRSCRVRLPDGRALTATFQTPLTTVNALAQTQSVLARINSPVPLPENLTVQVDVTSQANPQAQLLPKAAILSDEMLQHFWVMRLINDSTAVKVPVQLGEKTTTTVEVKSPIFGAGDRIITEGNYGLPDTARVLVNAKKL
ncbi:HlyD family efflux transporter periplasmic adaptor subunit [Spirosoma sp. HMF4905]|uniref:HlyD family efflux transporter periplasmic adaptor subunit n=1 Tax=Spirosoma arboris TaxID=2682092 RepID=A0A7K1SJE2_9BACT|nr:HlyD family efflux transporter periplasmic adaptor subunit [Spirosoma arboris]MVM33696.1 HlyD family efflux transporter periplasmic adaptor subunit [Spirosoma arboris]